MKKATPILSFSRPVDGALYMFDRGFPVFPLVPGTKIPPKNFAYKKQYKAFNRNKIEQYGTANPLANWAVLCLDHTIIDVDMKDGRNGIAAMEALEAANQPLPPTFAVITPTGGIQLYFKGSTKNTVDRLGDGLDTRSEFGYGLCPGSRIGDNSYTVADESAVQPLPDWLRELIPLHNDPVVLQDDQIIEKGTQHDTLVSLAGSMRARGLNADEIFGALIVVNDRLQDPAPESHVRKIAESIAKYPASEARVASDFLALPDHTVAITADTIDPAKIKKRDWIMHNRYIGGFISVIISPGGAGKSTLTMLDAVSVASAKPLTGNDIARSGAVWIYNTEDPIDELKRRMVAISIHHEIPLKTLTNVHITSGRTAPFILAKSDRNGVTINKTAIEKTIAYIKENNIVLLLADPFVRTHEVSENDNMQIDKVVWCFQRIADATGCAIGLVHHTNKSGAKAADPDEPDMHRSRGASALVYAARVAHTISTMTKEEAHKFGVHEDRRRWYFRLDNAKANMQPPAERADWYEKVNICIPNGDFVGTVCKSTVADVFEEKKQEAAEYERRDFAKCMAEIMKVGDRLTIKDLYTQTITNINYAHLTVSNMSLKRGREKLIEILRQEPMWEDKVFKYEFVPDKKPKHFVICVEAEDFLG